MASYTVKKGDTLSEIAKQYGTTYQDIAKANGISNPDVIYAGQKLNIGDNSATAPSTKLATSAPAATKTNTVNYQQSDAVKQAEAMLQQQMAQKPGAYQSQWQNQLNDAINKILNREKFSYDLNGDALYQQYKNQYVMQGQQAMMDTMGQAAALTGGYGNSYAQSAGQQAYHGHLQQLNDKIPELYQLALSKYQMEGDQMLDNAALMAQQENMDYGRYRDQMGDWEAERDYLSGRYDSERNYDYGQYIDDRNYQYQQGRDQVADKQWQAEFDEAKRQYDQAYAQKNGSSGDSGVSNDGGGDKTGGVGYDNGSLKNSDIVTLQKALGVTPDGKWGPATQAAAEKKWGTTSADKAWGIYNNGGDGDKLTYSDVALTAAQMRQQGASNTEIYEYISAIVYDKNYVPTTSINQDMMELRAGYVGSGR